MTIHANSVTSYRAEEPKLARRALDILFWVRAHGPATDRQIARGMGFGDMNSVRPRVTELVESGFLTELDSVKCEVTGRHVRRVGIPQKQGQLPL
jgi:hypothetical protein